MGRNRTAVQRNQLPRKGQPDAQSALACVVRLQLDEQIEHELELVRLDPDAGIAHCQNKLVAQRAHFPGRGDRHFTAAARELRRIVEKVREHLHEPCRIDKEDAGIRRELHDQSGCGLFQHSATTFDGGPYELPAGVQDCTVNCLTFF